MLAAGTSADLHRKHGGNTVRIRSLLAIALVTMGVTVLTARPAAAVNKIWTGRVVHVSTDNIKVRDKGGATLSFLIAPAFKNVFSKDGKTTYQMAALKPGTWVNVYYDQRLLGARHADKIIVLGTGVQFK